MQRRRRFLAGVGLAGIVGLAGCLGLGDGAAGSGTTPTGGSPGRSDAGSDAGTVTGGDTSTAPATTDTPTTGAPPPLRDGQLPVQYDFGTLAERVRSGGPPKDGIPSIDDPVFVAPDEAGVDPGDPVFGVVSGDDARAYPQSILVWHEIVNDVVDGTPVSVTYCPLTGTAMGFERGETSFGTSGNLLNNNLVMYDRGTDSRWPQVLATAITGRLRGRSLREFPVVWTTMERWRSVHPETTVLSTETGYARNYARDPYGGYNPKSGYYTSEETLFPRLATDERHPAKSVFLGVRTAEGVAIVDKAAIREEAVVTGTLGETPFVAVSDPELDTGYVYRNPDGLSVAAADGRVTVDGATHAPDSLPLERVVAPDGMWFAWSGFYPEGEVYP